MSSGQEHKKSVNRKRLLILSLVGLILLAFFILVMMNNWTIRHDTNAHVLEHFSPALRTIQADSISSMMNAINVAKPGDHIILKDGVYDNTNWLTEHSSKNMLVEGKQGNAGAPIVIRAQTVGGAVITGQGGFRFSNVAYLVISGFKFNHSQDNSEVSDDSAIQCELCKFVRFTRNEFSLTTSTTIPSNWLQIISGLSEHNRIDHNTFRDKNTLGVFLLVVGSKNEMAKYTMIDHNFFFGQSNTAGNGGECLRVGNSALGLKSAFTTIE